MGDVVDALGDPGAPMRAIHVGGAGMTLPRYLAATRPGSRQTVLEPDEELTALVRRDLPLPPRSGIKVRPVDGRAGLVDLPDGRADLLVLDAYDDGLVPPELLTAPALAEVARVLAPTGVALLNVVDRAPFPVIRSAAGLEPATRRARRPGNVLLLAGAAPVPVEAWRARSSTGLSPYQVLDGGQVSSSFGGGTPAQEADTACWPG